MSIIKFREYINEVDKLRPDCRYQNLKMGGFHVLFNRIPSFAWTTNKKFLRYSIENKDLTELRIDLDEKAIKDNINLMFDIEARGKELGMDISWYYSGGKGIHGHLLINLNNIKNLLKYNDFDLDLNLYSKEFLELSNLKIENQKRKKRGEDKLKIDLNKYLMKNLIQSRSDERAIIKKAIVKYMGFENKLDKMLFSSQEMFTYEGTNHRKTEKYKIHLDLRELKTTEDIINYISANQFTPYLIDFDFFSKVYTLDYHIIKFIVDYIEINKKKAPKQTLKKNNRNSEQIIVKLKENKEELSNYIQTFAYFFNNLNIESQNVYAYIVIKTIYKLCQNQEITEKYFTKFVELTNYNLTCSIESKVSAGIENYKKNPFIILNYKNYFTYRDFMRELRRIARENK